ncbi:MAG: formate dehydrogenase accessory sulfurtransferase FdhD [Deltaproteobacteria bacterium]|nr:formate dehydrogenase accessory sulfurtransferase FdhD [Deltaproteobacteria bacterium]
MTHKDVNKFIIHIYDGKRLIPKSVSIITEETIEIRLNHKKIITSACAGIHLDELAVGFLRSEGIIHSSKEIKEVSIHEKQKAVNVCTAEAIDFSVTVYPQREKVTSSGARIRMSDEAILAKKSLVNNPLRLSSAKALSLMDDMLAAAVLHEQTHGTHCSALATANDLIIFREDIGRHNTIDMLGGYALLSDLDLSDKILLTTGRISSEIVGKVWTMGIPVIISHSAPTSRALCWSEEAGITLVGYTRGGKMNIYTHGKRVNI